MGKIALLEKQVAELIAAGEVVERPSSIVKELIENSIDAGATAVTVEIHGGGISYLRVTDNGGGIPREDVPTAFLRHATSKIKSGDDLEQIMTMGFRGEALASVAAMCRVEMLTRTADETAGTCYQISGGEDGSLEDAGCPVGTTITVRDVFYNTPARMKFLKKDVSEGSSVAAVLEKAALANPGVAVRFIRDGVTKLQTPGDGKLISAVRCALGREAAENMIPVNYELDGLSLNGLVSRPSFAKGSRAMQNFFINTRFVRSKTCMAALEQAYRNAIMVGKFPSCVLNLSIPPQTVDVNVHPAKIEVRFSDEKSIFNLVYYGCKTAIGAGGLEPELTLAEKRRTMPEQPSGEQLRMTAEQYRNTFVENSEKPGVRVPWDSRTAPAPNAAGWSRVGIDISADADGEIDGKPRADDECFPLASVDPFDAFSGGVAPPDSSSFPASQPSEKLWLGGEFGSSERERREKSESSVGGASEQGQDSSPSDRYGWKHDESPAITVGGTNEQGQDSPPSDRYGWKHGESPAITVGGANEQGQDSLPSDRYGWKHDESPAITVGGASEQGQASARSAEADMYASAGSDPYENAVQLGEAFGTYVILESGDELLFIDKHAAHERLIFNRLMEQGVGEERQMLLSPISVRLSQEEYAAAIENLSLLEQAGITAEDFGDGHVVVRELAPILTGIDIEATLAELAGKLLRSNGELLPRQLENLYHTVACRAAVKAHDKTSPGALAELISMLRDDGDARHCPHGRPVCVRLSRRELEKRFGRLG